LFPPDIGAGDARGRVHADGYNILMATGSRVGKAAHMSLQASPPNPAGSTSLEHPVGEQLTICGGRHKLAAARIVVRRGGSRM